MVGRLSINTPIPRYLKRLGFGGVNKDSSIPANILLDNQGTILLDNQGTPLLDNGA